MQRIEKSAFRQDEYVGYAHGVWIITRSNSSYGRWCARHRDEPRAPLLYAHRLIDLDAKLGMILPTLYAR